MRTISYRIGDLTRATINIGRVAENEYTRVQIDAGEIYAEYPHAAVSLTVQPPAGEAFPAAVSREGDLVIWDVQDSALAEEGQGEIQLTFTDGGTVVKGAIGRISVCRSLIGEGEAPDPIEDFLAEAGAALTAIPETIAEALEEAKASGEFKGDKGDPGEPGEKGDPGYTPVKGVDYFDGQDGHTPVKGVDYFDGAKGDKGDPGSKGDPGHSPVLTASKSGKTTTIYSDGTQLAQILDGADGQGGDIIDDTTPALDKTFSSSKLSGDLGSLMNAINGVEDNIAPDYSDLIFPVPHYGFCFYNDELYYARQRIETSEAWTASHWSKFTVGDSLRSNMSNIETMGQVMARAYFKPASGIPASDLASGVIPSVPVQDVQVNGTSVLSNGVAEIPVASTSEYGAVKIGYGLQDYNDSLSISSATENQVKAGVSTVVPITPVRQNASAFYGFAKAAGDTTQSASSNAVGNYTESAKSAISEMLNGAVTVSGTTPSITGRSGIRYKCGTVSTLTITPPSSGCIDVVFTSGSTPTVLTVPSTVQFPSWFDPSSLSANTTYEINILDGTLGAVMAWA